MAEHVVVSVDREVGERHVNGAAGSDDIAVVHGVGGGDFCAKVRPVAERLRKRALWASGRSEAGASECEWLEDFSFYEICPGGTGLFLGHRGSDRRVDVR